MTLTDKNRPTWFTVFNPFRTIRGDIDHVCPCSFGTPRPIWSLSDANTGKLLETFAGSKTSAIQRATELLNR